MRAMICREWGEPSVLRLEDVPPPAAQAGEVLIDVRSASVNFADIVMVEGKYQTKPDFPFAPGLECAGTVAALGAGVDAFAVGDTVLAKLAHGGFAEQARADARDTHRVPAGGELAAGKTLLVLGASGGTGLSAVEIGKAMGATVIAAASTADKVALAREHGADHGVSYGDEDLKDRVMAITGGAGADVVFDPVGGDLLDAALSSLGWGGRYLVFGFTGGIPQIPANRLLVKHRSAMGCSLRYFRDRAPDKLAASMDELFAMYDAGHLHPRITATYPLEETVAAMEVLRARKATGRVVVLVG